MSNLDPQYSPLLQGEWSEEEGEEQGMLAEESLDQVRDIEKKGGLPFPQPYRHNRKVQKRVSFLYVFLAILAVISAGIVIAVISGVIRSHIGETPRHKPDEHTEPTSTTVQTTTFVSETPKTTTSSAPKITTSSPQMKTTSHSSNGKISTSHQNVQRSSNWRIVLNDTGTESCVRTPDIDGDGLPDVLVGLAHGVDLSTANTLDEDNSFKKYCEEKNQSYPCVGFLLALRGIDGKELWRLPTRSEVMFIMCDIDVNRDGVKDCIVTGRQSTIQAVELRNGKTLWYADGSEYPDHFKQTWNVYQAVPLPDVDGDGVADIVVAHGGDPNIDSKIHNRMAGRLIVLSSATGQPLGNYHEMPYSKETYMTPVIYTDNDGSQYLLFGSGGETVPGDLMVITLPDLLKITNQKTDLNLKGEYRLKQFLYPHSGIMVLYEGKGKGVMVPPVIVDVNNDGVKDILMSAFEGKMVMFDGITLSSKWERTFPGCESYSTPAPGYFDEDEYLDFMVHWSAGEWPKYNESTVLIISGKDGSILWENSRPLYVMSSDLVLRSQEDRMDYFMVKMRGRNDTTASMRTEAHGVGAQRNISRRSASADGGDEDSSFTCKELASSQEKHITCEQDLTAMCEEVYLLNRNNIKSCLPFQVTQAETFRYAYTPRADEESCMPIDSDTGKVHMCAALVPDSRSTDAVTDVDNDGRLDVINIALLEGRLRDSRYSFHEMKFTTIISRIDIETAVQDKMTSGQTIEMSQVFAPLESQPWLQYLGSASSSVFSGRGR